MSRLPELIDTLFLGSRAEDPYNRVFVVSAFSGVTDMLLEHKKTGEPGVYSLFSNAASDQRWSDALSSAGEAMETAHHAILSDAADLAFADQFVRERIEGARNCLIDLQRLCSYGQFRLGQQMGIIRELLSGLGEAHSAFVAHLALRRIGVNARFVDLSGWRDEAEHSLDSRINDAFDSVDLTSEMPIVTGYAQCAEGLMAEYDRGYSEVTFSRIAALTGAKEAIIHKEFHLSSADPKLVGAENVRKIGRTNYDVADQLSNLGMEAIHPSAAKTLRQAGVALRVANAFDPGDPGTLIDECTAEEPAAEIVAGIDVFALELFEPDMVGVKGYDAAILEALTRHDVWIVSKTSNANTITHYCDASLKAIRRVERDLAQKYPNAEIRIQSAAIASVVGRDLSGLKVLSRGLAALTDAGIDVIGAHQTSRRVDVQFAVAEDARDAAIKALHDAIISPPKPIKLAAVEAA